MEDNSFKFNQLLWNDNIPIYIDKLQNVDIQCYENLSIDGKLYANIIDQQDGVCIEIYEIKQNQLCHKINVPKFSSQKYSSKELKFSSEWLVYFQNKLDDKLDLYLHDFRLNKGKYITFQDFNCKACYFQTNQFHLLLQTIEEKNINLSHYKIDNEFQFCLMAVREIQFRYQIIEVRTQCIFSFIQFRQLSQLNFLSNQFKSLNIIVFKDFEKFGFYSDKPKFLLMKDIFLIDQDSQRWLIVAQNRNGKRIILKNDQNYDLEYRKIKFSDKKPKCFKMVSLQHYVFVIQNYQQLQVYDIGKGYIVGNLLFEGFWKLYRIKVTEDYLALSRGKSDHQGWPIRKKE